MNSPLPAPQSDALIPDAVRSAFDIVRPLGQGGMGSVWLARDRMLDRLVAIKVLLTSAASDATRERFLREAKTAAKLSHPNIVPVHRADESNGQVWFSMGFVEGESLGDRIRERGALPFTDVVRILRETSWALAYAHARGVIHRDVKPDNILLDRETGRTMVTDFGIARDLRFSDARLTADGSVLGTVHYMSPEQAADDPLDARSDVYSLGVVGFHALSNTLPFDGTPNAILVSHVTKPAPSLRSVAPQVPIPIAAVIDKCLAKIPADRWENAEALADALGVALDDMITADRDAVKRTATNVISERDAIAVWQRAAQLQAEAAHRMERSINLTAPSGDGRTDAAAATDAYRLSDVEAAAVEAGISRQFVALAMAERTEAAAIGGSIVAPFDDRTERRITTVLGATDRSISVSRVIKASPKETLALIGRIFTANPYHLKVRETVNGHPLDGGILRFDIPDLYKAMSDGRIPGGTVGLSAYGVIYQCSGVLDLNILNVTLKARGNASQPECEVIVSGDLRDGQRKNLRMSYWTIGGTTAGVGGVVLAVGVKIMGGLLLATPLGAGVASLTAIGTMIGYRAAYRRALRKAREELDKMLMALQQNLDSRALFGDLPAPPPALRDRHGSDNDGTLATLIS